MRISAKRAALFVGGLVMAGALGAATETFVFDKSHTAVGFRIRHWLTRVEGRFREYDGKIWLDRQNAAASKVDLIIQTASIDTGQERRDNHLRSADFFDAEKFPTITFKSTKVQAKGKDLYEVTGDLTMHGVTKTVVVPVRHTGFINLGKQEKAGFEITFPINRKDYGITWNRTADQGGAMLGDDVEINILVEANKEASEPAPAPAAPATPPAAPPAAPTKAPAR
jgi:polyisoprenoid-binding protein YceI